MIIRSTCLSLGLLLASSIELPAQQSQLKGEWVTINDVGGCLAAVESSDKNSPSVYSVWTNKTLAKEGSFYHWLNRANADQLRGRFTIVFSQGDILNTRVHEMKPDANQAFFEPFQVGSDIYRALRSGDWFSIGQVETIHGFYSLKGSRMALSFLQSCSRGQ